MDDNNENFNCRRRVQSNRCYIFKFKKRKIYCGYMYRCEEGFYSALTNIYDLIILDVMLPGMNGFDILKKLKEEDI